MKEKAILLLCYIAVLFLIIVGAASCSVAKKDQKAVNRVKANVELLNQVGKEWVKLNPCANDSTFIFNTDTLVTSDTAYLTDQVTVQDTVQVTKVITKTVRIRDSVKVVVQDKQQIELLKKDLSQAINSQIVYLNRALDAEQRIKILKQDIKSMWLYLIIAGLIIGILTYLLIKRKSLPKVNLN